MPSIWERAKARVAANLVSGLTPSGASFLSSILGTTGPGARRDSASILKQYANMPWLQSVVGRVMKTCGSIKFRVYVKQSNGKALYSKSLLRMDGPQRRAVIAKGIESGDYREIEESPFLDFLDAGNAALMGSTVMELTYGYRDLVGETFWLIERNGLGVPVAPWPIPAHWVQSLPTPSNPFYRLCLPNYRQDVPAEDMVYFKNADPFDPYGRGVGLVTALADELEADEFAAKHVAAWFRNRARPDLLIYGKGISPEDTKRLETRWVQEHRGFWNQFKPHFLSATDLEIKELNQSFQQMELIPLRASLRDIIVQVFGTPPEVLGINVNSNRATSEVADYLFMSKCVLPRVESVRQVLQIYIAPQFDERLIVEYDEFVPADKEFQKSVQIASPWAYTVDEWRQMAGQDPLPNGEGELFMVPLNLVAVRSLGELSYDSLVPALPAEPEDDEPEPEEEEPESEPPRPEDDETEKTRTKAVTPNDLLDLVVEFGDPLLTATDIELIAQEADAAVLHARMRPVLTDTVEAFGIQAIREVGLSISFNLQDPRVTRYLLQDSATRITGMVNETTRNRIRSVLSDGVAEGRTMSQLQDSIVSVFDDARGLRSHVIARTETHNAANFGAYEGLRDAGMQQAQWLITPGANHRDTHSEGSRLDGQIRNLNQPFESDSGATALYPGAFGVPEEDIQCLCRVVGFFGKGYTAVQKRKLWETFQVSARPYIIEMRRAVRRGLDEQQSAVLEMFRTRARKD